jgi:two-component system CheB/CheR fusion protein
LVGIGASAGGLQALRELVAGLGAEPGVSLIVVQHLDPVQPSALTDLLSRAGTLHVVTARDGDRPHMNVMYVGPPGRQLTLDGGRLRLRAVGKSHAHAIDEFMRSLAADAGHRAVGVLLSGSGHDGREGMAAIHAAGGITLAQDDSATFDAMPQAAVRAGVVDRVASPRKIAEQLLALRFHPYLTATPSEPGPQSEAVGSATPGAPGDAARGRILEVMRARRHVDFSRYKEATLQRRIQRRMALAGILSSDEYAERVERDGVEADALFEDILIGVTEFFRDREAFEALRTAILPRLARDREVDAALRVWVVGCSTGQEAYSIAMSALEFQEEANVDFSVQIFATDISEDALSIARRGFYPTDQCVALGKQRCARFLEPVAGGFRMRRAVRELCVFARHDVTRDPPFSRIDLVCCRNLLIYLSAELQRTVLPILHYSMRPGGVLMLGKAESIGRHEDLFGLLDKDHRFFERRPASRSRLPTMPNALPFPPRPVPDADPTEGRGESIERDVDQLLLDRYAPAGVLVDEEQRVMQFRGDTSPYLHAPSGTPTVNLLELAHADLLPHLSAALDSVRETGRESSHDGVRIRTSGSYRLVRVRVIPLPDDGSVRHLVLFEETSHGTGQGGATLGRIRSLAQGYSRRAWRLLERGAHDEDPQIEQLVSDLALTRRRLNILVDEHEAKSEELKAANEEILSSNEELQSTNEELQTAKEEVQATNEELTTVNQELEVRNEALTRLNDDLNNLLSSIKIPIVMLGQDRRIRRFTPTASDVLNLIPGDVGRPLEHIRPDLEHTDLDSLLAPVLDDLQVTEREVRDSEGRWYRVTARPYRTSDDRVDGAVMAIVDIDDLKRTEHQVRIARDFALSIVQAVHEALVVVDVDRRVVMVNAAYSELFRVSAEQSVGRRLWDIDPTVDAERLRPWLDEAFATGRSPALETSLMTEWNGRRELRWEASKVGEDQVLVVMDDVTALRQQQRAEADLTDSVLAAQAEEREYLAQELHDETGQALSALLVGLRSVEERVGEGAVAKELERLRGQVRALVESVRRMARGLHPTVIEQLGFGGALRELVSQVGADHTVDIELRVDDDERLAELPLTMGVALYRVIQEALTNVVRHSHSASARVEVAVGALSLSLVVHDDGRGFDPERASSGLGLPLMRRRVQQLGGTLEVQSVPGNGARLLARVPLRGAEGMPA